jgi:hypothetical protein
MAEIDVRPRKLRRDHPVFFWGALSVAVLLLAASAAVATRIPRYHHDAAVLDGQMTRTERETRDRILNSRAQRSRMAVALLRHELKLKAMAEKGLHLAINTQDSTLTLRHGSADLRKIRIRIGRDSVIQGPQGQSWRFVRALGERHVEAKETDPDTPIPEWVYVSRGQAVPPASERQVDGANGHYVLRLDDGTEIYSHPDAGPFSQGVKPAAFEADAHDLGAIFDAVGTDTPVYIY